MHEGRYLMTPLRQHMIAALQLSGKGERTPDAYVRDVRLLAQFYHKSPDRISAQALQHSFLHRKTAMASPPRPCASATAASASSLRTSASATGTPERSCAHQPLTVSPPSS